MPVTISGGGTGLTGGRVAQGGWVISLEKFTRLDVSEGRATVGAGLLLKDLKAPHQFYAPDPTETWASLGGTIATNASGSRSFRYGATRRHNRTSPRSPDGRPHTRRTPRRARRFLGPRTPPPAHHQAHCGLLSAPRYGLGRSLHRFRRHARHRPRSRSKTAAEPTPRSSLP